MSSGKADKNYGELAVVGMNLKARWVFFEEVFTCRWVRRKSVQKGAGSKRLDREEHRLMKVNWSTS